MKYMKKEKKAIVSLQDVKGALVCGVVQKGNNVYVLAESQKGETYAITLSGKPICDVEGIFRALYEGCMKAVNNYHDHICEKKEEYQLLLLSGKRDFERYGRLYEELFMAENIFGDNSAYTAHAIMRKKECQFRKFSGMLAMVQPVVIEIGYPWKLFQKKRYVKINDVSEESDERVILIPLGRKTLAAFNVVHIHKDNRSIADLGKQLYGILVPTLSPWWQEKYRVARYCFMVMKSIELEEDAEIFEELCKKFERLLAPFSEKTDGNKVFCSYLRREFAAVKNEAEKRLGITEKEK
jgi:hypothetical protein